jgi:hypothetical protein
MEGDKKEKSCLSAIYVYFPKYLSLKVPRMTYRKKKKNSRTSFFQVGVSDVGRNLLIFSVETKTEKKKMSKIILEQHRLIRILPVLRQ